MCQSGYLPSRGVFLANPAGKEAFAVISVKGGYEDIVGHCDAIDHKYKDF